MPRGRQRFGRRFGHTTRYAKPAVSVIPSVRKRRCKCDACALNIEAGETYTILRLSKRYAVTCISCGLQPKFYRRYHAHCVPADTNKAMGYDPNHVNPNTYVSPTQAAGYHSVPPPPKPKTTTDLKIESLLAFEAALTSALRDRSVPRTPELEKQLGTLANIKQRIVRASTPGEAEAAANVALKKLIDVCFVNN